MLSFSKAFVKKTRKLTYLFLFFTLGSYSQIDTVSSNEHYELKAKNQHVKSPFTEKDILIDSSSIESHTFDKKFKSKYTDDNFIYEYKSKEKNAWDRFLEWLAGIFRRLFSFSNNETSMRFVVWLIKIIAFVVIIFAIYLIVKSILNKEGSWIFGRNSDKKMIQYDEIEKNIQNIDFEKLIQTTLQNGEKRLTIRYYYLWLLKKLAAREIIVLDIEKTNSDYMYEIKNPKLKDDFAYSSYLYNYIWYGEFDLDDDTFEKAKTTFEKTIKSI
ncbi:MAG: DUF4129 domain-containing protein [Flavobacterium sp.]